MINQTKEFDRVLLGNFRDNERNTNKLVCFVLISFILLSALNEFSLTIRYIEGLVIANHYVYFPCCIFVVITILLAFIYKFDKPWIKYLLIFGMVVFCCISYLLFTIYSAYFLLIPIVVSSRYFDRTFSFFVIISTLVLFFFASFVNIALNGISPSIDYMHKLITYNTWNNVEDALSLIVFPITIVLIFVGFFCTRVTGNGLNLIKKESAEYLKNSKYENELKVAAEIQKSTLPNEFFITSDNNFEICAGQIAAKEVCGDIYDYFMLNKTTLAFIVADVADKGLSAAMFMMAARKAMQCALKCSDSLADAIKLANKLICNDNPKGMFVTLWLGIIDTLSGIGQFVNAGHLPPIIKHKDGTYEIITNEPDLFIGNFPEMPPKVYKLYMNAGDVLLLYTDGITDARNINGKDFTMNSIVDIMKRSENDPHVVINNIISEVTEFSKGTDQFDDMTLLAVKCNSTKPSSKLSICNEIGLNGTKRTIDSVDELLKSIYCPEEMRRNIDVVVDEICTNISDYAYESNGKIYLDIVFGNNYADLIFRDDGVPFNPLENNQYQDNDELHAGGWGIYLTKKLSNEINYCYVQNQNVLTIRFLWNLLNNN